MAYNIEKLTGYVQRVLPQVYDDTMSYQELLYAVLQKLNEVIEQSNDYFSQDIVDVVEQILKKWQEDGTLGMIISDALHAKTRSFIGTGDFSNLQAAIDYAVANGKTLLVDNGTHVLTSGLVIDGPLKMIGNPRNTVLDFSTMTIGPAVTIGNQNAINGLELDGFTLLGNVLIDCLKLNGTGTITKAVTDSVLRNLRIEGFNVGMTGTYNWCNLFENIRFQDCVKPLKLGSQFNNSEFLRCSMVSFSESMDFTNCEGIHFTSPNIANFTGAAALDIFQSFISMTNPYFEYIAGTLAQVGRSSELINSVLTIDTPKVTDASEKIVINGHHASVQVRNPDKPFYIDQYQDRVAAGKFSAKLKVDTPLPTLPQYLVNYYGQQPYAFASTNSAYTLTTTKNEDDSTNIDIQVTAGGEAFAGIRLSDSLVVGQRYTLKYAVQATTAIAFKNSESLDLLTTTTGNGFVEYSFPFVAKSTRAELIWSSSTPINLMKVALIKGQQFQ